MDGCHPGLLDGNVITAFSPGSSRFTMLCLPTLHRSPARCSRLFAQVKGVVEVRHLRPLENLRFDVGLPDKRTAYTCKGKERSAEGLWWKRSHSSAILLACLDRSQSSAALYPEGQGYLEF